MTKTTTRAAARTSNPLADHASDVKLQGIPTPDAEGVLQGQPSDTVLGPRTPSAIVAQLWEAAAPNLTREQLQWFAQAGGDAFESAQHLCRVMAGVGCLIAEDSADGRVGAGSFRDGVDAMQLLTAFSEALDGISSMMYVADAAVADLIWEPPTA